ncbi:MAG: ADP-ribosylglycohydrolase family protein [Candidatus Zixiibacteriota bacterium]
MKTVTKNLFRGCLLGQCLGDALGAPVEGCDGDTCYDYIYNKVEHWYDRSLSDEHWIGQYTDDSQLARELTISLVKHSDFNPEDYAGRIAEIFKENRIVGRGIASDNAARRLIAGAPWDKAGMAAPAAGNGTAMRAAPIGMFYYDNQEKLTEYAHQQGYITHQDPRCSAGSIAIAGAVALVLRAEDIRTDEFVTKLFDWMRPYHEEFAQLVLQLPDFITEEPEEVVDTIAHAGMPPGQHPHWPGISPFVVSSVIWSLYAFLKYPDSYQKAVNLSIQVGSDVDTTGAMTGAISGAYLGLEALPKHLVEKVNDYDTWGYSELVRLADRCYDIVHG